MKKVVLIWSVFAVVAVMGDTDMVIPDTGVSAPSSDQLLGVSFRDQSVSWGETMAKNQTSAQPTVQFQGANSDKTYGLIMYDPDAPSRERAGGKSWLHWLVLNMKGSVDPATGRNVVTYNGPSPPSGTGNHRYVLMVFEMKSSISNPKQRDRARFDLQELKENYGFDKIAAQNYFVVKG